MNVSAPGFVKCLCQYCNGHIEFDATRAGELVACPHCGLETELYVPQRPLGGPPAAGSSPSPTTVSHNSVEIKRLINPIGIAALALGIISGLLHWIPVPGNLAGSLAVVGLLLAFAGLVAAMRNKKAGYVLPLSAGVVCVLSILVNGSPIRVTISTLPVYVTNYVAVEPPFRQTEGNRVSPVHVTNYVVKYITNALAGGQSSKPVPGKLDTMKTITGECTHVARNGIVVQQFVVEIERVYGPRKSSSLERKGLVVGDFPAPRTVLSLKEKRVPTQKVFLRNYADMQDVAVGQQISARARRAGTTEVQGERLECWDCGR